MAEKINLPSSLLEKTPWSSSVLILRRNLGKYFFPSKIKANEAKQALDLIKNTLLNIKELEKPIFIASEDLSPNDRELLYEHFLFLKNFQELPLAGAVVIDNSASFLALINYNNHLELYLLDFKSNLENAWTFLKKIESSLNQALDFAFSQKFGYLTSDPAECGTALSIQTHLHLPALIYAKQLEEILSKQSEEGIIGEGFSGNLADLIGDIVVLQNRYSLGVTEDAILHGLQTTAAKLIASEKKVRSHFKEQTNPSLRDQVSKAYGVLIHSYQLETKEALSLLSLMLLGIECNWITGITPEKLQEVFFKCRRGHLSHLLQQPMDAKEIPHKRAEFIHQQLQGMQLQS